MKALWISSTALVVLVVVLAFSVMAAHAQKTYTMPSRVSPAMQWEDAGRAYSLRVFEFKGSCVYVATSYVGAPAISALDRPAGVGCQ